MTPTRTEPDTLSRVPNQPKTPVKCFRCSDELWQQAIALANDRGLILSEEMRKWLQEFVEGKR